MIVDQVSGQPCKRARASRAQRSTRPDEVCIFCELRIRCAYVAVIRGRRALDTFGVKLSVRSRFKFYRRGSDRGVGYLLTEMSS